jgi:hypothetical protein
MGSSLSAVAKTQDGDDEDENEEKDVVNGISQLIDLSAHTHLNQSLWQCS